MGASNLYPTGSAFSIDGVLSDRWHVVIGSIQWNVLPSARSNLLNIPGLIGKANPGAEWSSRLFSLDLVFLDRGAIFTDMSGLSAALNPINGDHQLILLDEQPGWHINCIPAADSQLRTGPNTGKVTLALEAADPLWYSNTSRTEGGTLTNGGAPLALPYGGNVSAPPVITVTVPPTATQPITGIKLSYGGSAVNYAGSLSAPGDKLVIDCGKYTVTKNGGNDIANWSGDFPFVPVGGGSAGWSDTNNQGGVVQFVYPDRFA